MSLDLELAVGCEVVGGSVVSFYETGKVPAGYVCVDCGVSGVKLWRRVLAPDVELRCGECVMRYEEVEGEFDEDGYRRDGFLLKSDQCGHHYRAVPMEDGQTYGSHPSMSPFLAATSVPRPGVSWWRGLPTKFPPGTVVIEDELEGDGLITCARIRARWNLE